MHVRPCEKIKKHERERGNSAAVVVSLFDMVKHCLQG